MECVTVTSDAFSAVVLHVYSPESFLVTFEMMRSPPLSASVILLSSPTTTSPAARITSPFCQIKAKCSIH
jgi:hypothetical protein